jgi:hypothetical protein
VVVNSHKITPKLYTSHLQANCKYYILNSYIWLFVKNTHAELTYFSLAGSFRKTSGAIHSGWKKNICLGCFS